MIKYRPEIDGLRAVAIGAVFFYHSNITLFDHQFFKGGFIGVDIFFVISGYLITSIILNELITTGSFSFKRFYERRARRILPALLIVILLSLPFAWTYLLPIDFVNFSNSILYSLGFSSNFYFHYSGQQYGAESGLLQPFLHTWSLSVEEQFYILFPIFLLITFKYFRKYLIHILILVFAISLGLADWGSRNHPSFNFYVLPTRGWELIAGSILAYFEITKGHRSNNKILNLALPSVGLILIGHSILFFNDKMFHPSFYTLSPIIGVCLIIWFSNKDELVNVILSSKLFVGIGLISYSLYLYHYPIFSFFRIHSSSLSENLIYAIISVVSLSVISFYFIERPFRTNNFNKSRIRLILVLIFYSITILFSYKIIINKGYPERLPELFGKELIEYPWNTLKDEQNKICYNNPNGCQFFLDSTFKKKRIYFVGDSHMASISNNFKNNIVNLDYEFYFYGLGECFYFPGFSLMELKTRKIHSKCNANYFNEINKSINNSEESIVIIGGRLPLYLEKTQPDFVNDEIIYTDWNYDYITNEKFTDLGISLKRNIELVSKNNIVILIYPIPEIPFDVPRLILKNMPKKIHEIKKYFKPSNYITLPFQEYLSRTNKSFELLDSISGDNIIRVYPDKIFCNTLVTNECVTHDDKNIFYADGNHLSTEGSEMLVKNILMEIKKISD